jgi:hypothetical protein|tara:strand:- start:263 stop:580 length:318 start_codon:yes stop_codon:yes gene_type:complete
VITFEDLEFKTHPVSKNGVQALLNLGKFEVSVVDLKSDGPMYEVAVFANGNFVQLPGVHPNYGEEGSDDVIHYQTADKITEIIQKINQINLDFVEIFGQPEMDFR